MPDERKLRVIHDQNSGERREKFVRLAEKRTANAIKAIRVIGKLGNRSHYEYDDKDIKKIIAALNKELDALRVRMTTPGSQENIDFKL